MNPVSSMASIKIKFDIQRCKGCGLCVHVCPKQTLEMSDELNQAGQRYAQLIDKDECTGCGLCFQMCPDLIIEIVRP